jgi:type IV secretory pathway VirB3-like protein
MPHTNLFVGLTRPVAVAGLPMVYLALLIGVTMIGFLITKSFIFLLVSGGAGYGILRALAAHDSKLLDVALVVLRASPLELALFTKKGLTYRA